MNVKANSLKVIYNDIEYIFDNRDLRELTLTEALQNKRVKKRLKIESLPKYVYDGFKTDKKRSYDTLVKQFSKIDKHYAIILTNIESKTLNKEKETKSTPKQNNSLNKQNYNKKSDKIKNINDNTKISDDNKGSWQTLKTFTDAENGTEYQFYEYDLSGYTMSANFYIAFESNALTGTMPIKNTGHSCWALSNRVSIWLAKRASSMSFSV